MTGLTVTGLAIAGLPGARLTVTGLPRARLPITRLARAGLTVTRLAGARLPVSGLPRAGLSRLRAAGPAGRHDATGGTAARWCPPVAAPLPRGSGIARAGWLIALLRGDLVEVDLDDHIVG